MSRFSDAIKTGGGSMTERDDWGPWLWHDGKGCSCRNAWVRLAGEFGGKAEGCAGNAAWTPHWAWEDGHERILRYQIRRTRALLQLIDMVESLPAPARETEPA